MDTYRIYILKAPIWQVETVPQLRAQVVLAGDPSLILEHGSLQLPIIPVPGNLIPSSDMQAAGRHMVRRRTCIQNIHARKINLQNPKLSHSTTSLGF